MHSCIFLFSIFMVSKLTGFIFSFYGSAVENFHWLCLYGVTRIYAVL